MAAEKGVAQEARSVVGCIGSGTRANGVGSGIRAQAKGNPDVQTMGQRSDERWVGRYMCLRGW